MSNMDLRCPQCGAPITAGQRHCGNCGTVIQWIDGLKPTADSGAPAQTVMSSSNPNPEPAVFSGYDSQPVSPSNPTVLDSDSKVGTDPYAQPLASGNYSGSTYPQVGGQAGNPVNPPYPIQGAPNSNSGYPPLGAANPNPPYPPYQGPQPGTYPPPYAANAPYQQPPNAPYPGGYIPVPQAPQRSGGHRTAWIISLTIVVVVIVLCVGSVKVLTSALSSQDTGTDTLLSATSTSSSHSSLPAVTGKPIFEDNFSSNSKGWLTYSGQTASVQFQSDGLKLHDEDGSYMLATVPYRNDISDFRLDMTYTPSLEGDEDQAGIVFREQPTPDNDGPEGYLLKIDNAGDYLIRKITVPVSSTNPNGTYLDLGQGKMAVPPLTGSPLDVTLIAKGNVMVLYLNGTYQDTITDAGSSFTKGTISLFVENVSDDTSADATFKHIAVYSAPASLPAY